MASRYASQTGNSGPTYSGSIGSSNEQSSTQSSSSSSESTSSSGRSSTSFNIDTMSSTGRSSLNQLIAQLAAGGTDAQRKNRQLQLSQVNNLEALSRGYSRQNAFADAEGLLNQILRQALEQGLPSILQAQAAAGTSGDALSALLTQDLATRSSEAAAAQGLGAAVDYGQILAGLQGQKTDLLSSLTDEATNALLGALGIDAGSMKRGTETTRSSSSSKSHSSQSGTSITNSKTTGQQAGVESSNQSDVNSFLQKFGA